MYTKFKIKISNNERGVAFILEIVLLVAVISVIGLAILAAKYANDKNELKTQASASIAPLATPAPDKTSNWTIYKSNDGKFTLKYNQTWKMFTSNAEALSSCNKDRKDNILNLETQDLKREMATGCGGYSPGQIHVAAIAGVQNNDGSYYSDTNMYSGADETVVVIDGVTGVRYSAVVTRNMLGGKRGTKLIDYRVYTNGINYSLTMQQDVASSEITNDFELMVKSLRFTK